MIFVGALLGSTYAAVAVVVVILGVLAAAWKLIGRGAEGIVLFNKKIVPNVQYMDLLPKLDAIHSVLEDLVSQTRRDSGSTLKDDLDLLRKYAEENRQAALEAKGAAAEAQSAVGAAAEAAEKFAQVNASGLAALEILVGTLTAHAKDDRDLARSDRDLARDALQRMVALTESAARTEASGERVEAASAAVAEDLAAKQERADAVHEDEPPGTASDAASQSPDGE